MICAIGGRQVGDVGGVVLVGEARAVLSNVSTQRSESISGKTFPVSRFLTTMFTVCSGAGNRSDS